MNRVECPDCGRTFDNEVRAGSLEPYHMVMQSEHGKITTVPAHECRRSPGHAGGRNKTALVTGSAGFLGRHLVPRLEGTDLEKK